MDIAFDTTWCPVCSRQILPKRYYVPIVPPSQAPAVPPSSPTSDSNTQENAQATRFVRTKTGTIRARGGGGLVHGTGRVRPNGAIKRSDTVKEPKKATSPPPAVDMEPSLVRPAGQVRHRTIIDQSPVPLYCSDECRLADLQSSYGSISIDYNPERCISPPLPPVPHNSYSDISGPEESDSGSGASYESCSSIASSPGVKSQAPTGRIPKGYAALARLYDDLPPPPPAPPAMCRPTNDSDVSVNDYQSGVMMAARRIKATLCQEPPKKDMYGATQVRERKPIPGWTDGSHAWRASVYNLTAPHDFTKSADTERAKDAYKGFAASSHRSRSGVYSTLSDIPPTVDTTPASSSAASLPTVAMGSRSRSAAEELSKYPLFTRRADSRNSFTGSSAMGLSTSPTGSTRSLPVSTAPRRKEFSLVKPGAEGRLLVPDVKMTRTPSNLTVSSEASSSWGSGNVSGYYGGVGRKRSPLSRQNSDASMESADSVSTEEQWPQPSSQGQQTRGWSYSDDTMTFPILQLPRKKEKRMVRRIVDGEERDVEEEVEIIEPLKRLFLFPAAQERRR
ncbi:uncharacterized protein FIBRA_08765 [Fibroporia radiculosa]|uniref:Uncharacterized protein n=1 Tax=Fibroporia radiculosa TaxID=599839 RepID=J4GXD5_9APHY|nr:uncharacterized protein FIBRA_08765 [Fibroporia radiculosa]CCM06495.1 predicted protein [Fibroporia radiculosa]